MVELMKKVAAGVDRVKSVEQNRKFFLTFYGMTAALVLVCLGKIDSLVFKDIFLIALAIFSCANVLAKFVANQIK